MEYLGLNEPIFPPVFPIRPSTYRFFIVARIIKQGLEDGRGTCSLKYVRSGVHYTGPYPLSTISPSRIPNRFIARSQGPITRLAGRR